MRNLFYFELKKQLWLTMIFGLMMAALSVAAIVLFKDDTVEIINHARGEVPWLFEAFRIRGSARMLDHMTSLLYGFIMPVLGSLLAVLLSSRLIPAQIQTGELSYYLTLPLHRYTLMLLNTAVVLVCLMIALVINLLGTIIAAVIFKPGLLNMGWFLVLNIGTFCLWAMSAGLALMTAGSANNQRECTRPFLTVFFIMFFITMISQIKAIPGSLAFLSIYSLWNPQNLSTGRSFLFSLLMPAIGGLFLLIGIYRFSVRDLPL